MSLQFEDRQLIELSAASIGLKGYWDTVPGVTPPQEAFYIESSSAGTMSWVDEWNPLRDEHTRYRLIRKLGLITRHREILDKHIAFLLSSGMEESQAVDRAIVCVAAELVGNTNQKVD